MKRKIFDRRLWAIVLLLTGIGGCTIYALLGAADAQFEIGESPLRLHILANSDDPADQQLKLALRDYIIDLVGETMAESADKQEAMAALQAALPRLTLACNDFLAGRADYGAELKLAISPFPEIDYGSYTLPAGQYDALRIVLGEGQGHNWWCVLFPPLCFVDLAGEREAVSAVSQGAPKGDTLEVRFKLMDVL